MGDLAAVGYDVDESGTVKKTTRYLATRGIDNVVPSSMTSYQASCSENAWFFRRSGH